jgi:hypothetical protein
MKRIQNLFVFLIFFKGEDNYLPYPNEAVIDSLEGCENSRSDICRSVNTSLLENTNSGISHIFAGIPSEMEIK